MYNLTLQILITLFGIVAIYLLSLKHKVRRYGFVAGLISDVFWIWWILLTGNYVFLVFTFARLFCYLNGIRNYFIKKSHIGLTVVKKVKKGNYHLYGGLEVPKENREKA